MSENRIRVKVEPELTPVRLEDKMDLNAAIDVQVDSHLTGLGVVGGVLFVAGTLALVAGAVLFVTGYPDQWYDEDKTFVKAVVLTLAGGIIAFFFGWSTFFYGRTVLGSGRLDEYQVRAQPAEEPAAAAAEPPQTWPGEV